jgi:TolA-binding protein
MTMGNTTFPQIARTRKVQLCCVVLLNWVAGCATPWERSALLKDNLPNIDRVQGPTERSLRNVFRKKQEDGETDGAFGGKSLKPMAGTEEYLAATQLYKDEKYAEAQKAFHKVKKKYKKSEIREDALFMEAESAWQQDQYSKAHDIYAVLLKEYPSTRHLNVVSERLFKIGRIWLDFPEVAKLGEIHQVNFDDPKTKLPSEEPPKIPKSKPLFVPNFTDKKEPLFDTPGNGVAALSAVWMNDPTGPLADDAMMLVASYHARKGNYIESDRFFQMLRETFPNSPHLQNAFLLGSHVKLMSYMGPDYEARTLEEAQKLKEATIRLYPNLPEQSRLKDELARIEDAKALIDWSQVGFWLRKGDKRAAAIYCHQVISKYPKSKYARQAHAKLVELGPEYASGAVFLRSTDPKKTSIFDPFIPKKVEYRLRNYPVVGAPRDKSNSSGKSKSKSTDNTEDLPQNRSDQPDVDESEAGNVPDPGDEPVTRPRRSPGWNEDSPERLPPGSESEAKEINSKKPGRARL